MNVSLTVELEKRVAERVASGRYASASEVIREALRLLDERDRLGQLRRDVWIGLEQLDRGRGRPFDNRALDRIKRAGRERLAASRAKARAR
ncbi:MAG: type II toxin-antitoxin system ParD family antitoxin [Candidatus Binataceae bacterium]